MTSELGRTKSLWRELYALGTLSDADRFLRRIEESITKGDHDLKWPLWTAFIVSYTKPFTSNQDIGSISTKAIPEHLKDLHISFTKARNLLYGHTDPTETLEDGGQANQIIIRKMNGIVEIRPHTLVPSDEEIPNAKQLVAVIIADLRERTGAGKKHLIAQINDKPDGEYLFVYPNLPVNVEIEYHAPSNGRRSGD
jgi:hypothetical protein